MLKDCRRSKSIAVSSWIWDRSHAIKDDSAKPVQRQLWLTVKDSRLRPLVTNVNPWVSIATPVFWTCSSTYLQNQSRSETSISILDYFYLFYLFIPDISIALPEVHYNSEALPTQHRYCAGVSRRSATGNCRLRTCPRSLRRGKIGIRTTTLLRLKGVASTNAPPLIN